MSKSPFTYVFLRAAWVVTLTFFMGAAHAQSSKCIAQGNLAATMLKNRGTINEALALDEYHLKATPIDYGIIRLSALLAYHPKITDPKVPQQAIQAFCEQILALPLRLGSIENSPFYPQCIDARYAKAIDTFRRTGDQPDAIKRALLKQVQGITHRDRLLKDYLALLVDLMHLESVTKATPVQLQGFERATCSALLDLTKDLAL